MTPRAIIAALCLSTSASAGVWQELRDGDPILNKKLVAIELLPAAYGQLALHELSHGLYAMARGDAVTFQLYPHQSAGTFEVASTIISCEGLHCKSPTQTAAILDVIEVLGVAAAIHFFPDMPWWLHTTLRVIQMAATADFVYNSLGLWSGHRDSDFATNARQLKLDIWPARLLGSALDAGLIGTTLFGF